MGQIFSACAYDIDTRTSCVMDADKFYADCYSFSGTVRSIHYLLRQKPYRVMWGGIYVVTDDNIRDFTREEDLLGLSTYLDYELFEMNTDDLPGKDYYDKVKFVGENNKTWHEIEVWDEAKEYFKQDQYHSVRYSGYLLNHTKKLAINLEKYYELSRGFLKDNIEMAIDAVPILTETGGGTIMALIDGGVSAESTEELAEEWCGDLLQITDDLPDGFQLITCCFADASRRAKYCFEKYGVNEHGFILKDDTGKLFQAIPLNGFGRRQLPRLIRVEQGVFTEVKVHEGPAEVWAENWAKGRAEGLAEGEAKGEAKANRANAARMKEAGMETALIEKYTGLSREEIEKL